MAIEVKVTFESGKIEVSPDPVRFDWRSEDEIRWTLSSADTDAVLKGILFKKHQLGPPFAQLAQHSSNPKIWKAGECSKRRGRFKYDVVVTDGSGKDVVLDPTVMTGDPPGRS